MQPASFQYLKQAPPGLIPKIFAPEIVSKKNQYEFGSVLSRDGKEFYYAVEVDRKPHIRLVKFENNQWTEPVKLPFSDQYGYNDPFLSPDEKKLFFISDRALDGKGPKKDIDIWYVKRQENGWSDPINAGSSINSNKNEYYVSFTKGGTLYFSSNTGTDEATAKNFDIYAAQFANGTFQTASKLSAAINTQHYEADVFIAPDEQYIIYCAERPDGHGQGDLFVSFKDGRGQWQEAKNMGNAVNTTGYEFCPFVSADGKYLFFSRDGDIYWVDAKVIKTLR
ncbi:MAG: PD40 domain-containing protein [Ferruginibacter sp.]|nr:PD40 domain-containing protein [Cytophagales bacterium]